MATIQFSFLLRDQQKLSSVSSNPHLLSLYNIEAVFDCLFWLRLTRNMTKVIGIRWSTSVVRRSGAGNKLGAGHSFSSIFESQDEYGIQS